MDIVKKRERNRRYREAHRGSLKDYQKQYRIANRATVLEGNNKYRKRKRQIDPSFKMRANLSSSIYYYLKLKGASKNGSIINFLPFRIDELKAHLEKQFQPWMNWTNWGPYNSQIWNDDDQSTWTWQIDHIIPHSKFKYSSMEEQAFRDCWALSNLRPYSAKQNVNDGARNGH